MDSVLKKIDKSLKRQEAGRKGTRNIWNAKQSKMRDLDQIISSYTVNVNGLIIPFRNRKSNWT